MQIVNIRCHHLGSPDISRSLEDGEITAHSFCLSVDAPGAVQIEDNIRQHPINSAIDHGAVEEEEQLKDRNAVCEY